jgi:hypothetical protein
MFSSARSENQESTVVETPILSDGMVTEIVNFMDQVDQSVEVGSCGTTKVSSPLVSVQVGSAANLG